MSEMIWKVFSQWYYESKKRLPVGNLIYLGLRLEVLKLSKVD